MLPIYEKVEANINHSFYVNKLTTRYFPSPLHFHPEVEILLVVQGTGTRLIADSVEFFKPGDLVMIGKNVPHVWISDNIQTQKNKSLISEAIYILFKTEFIGEQFWQLPESKSILILIQNSQRGIKLHGKTREEVSILMKRIANSTDFSRITLLFTILEKMASSQEYHLLASPDIQNDFALRDSERLNRVYQYVINNFSNKITLKSGASVASFSVPAFCSYFKKRTNKTFIKFLNEIRIRHACRLLVDENYPINEVSYRCGFTNFSYFIKQFRKITGFTPLKYRKNIELRIQKRT
jgi:AraC-like DNA-binding protein